MQDLDNKVMNRLRVLGWAVVALLLLAPAVAMQFTDEVAWSVGDFTFAGLLLIGSGLACELIVRRTKDNAYRVGAVLALAAAFLLTWMNAAVGLVGSGPNLANILYFLLPLGALMVGIVTRFRARDMYASMVTIAVLQVLITALAFALGLARNDSSLVIMGINIFFAVLWTGSAILFRKASGINTLADN